MLGFQLPPGVPPLPFLGLQSCGGYFIDHQKHICFTENQVPINGCQRGTEKEPHESCCAEVVNHMLTLSNVVQDLSVQLLS